jgi:uncharacterized protein YjbJ (UPF0337 family)
MSAPSSSAPGSSTPGGELQQISPGACPTANGGQTENSLPAATIPQVGPASINSVAEQLRDNWERIKGNLRKQYGELTDDDLLYVEGEESAMIDRIRQKTGRSRAEINEALGTHG